MQDALPIVIVAVVVVAGVVAVATLLLEPRRVRPDRPRRPDVRPRGAPHVGGRSVPRRGDPPAARGHATPAAPRAGDAPLDVEPSSATRPTTTLRAEVRAFVEARNARRDRPRPAAAGRRGRGRAAACPSRTGSLPPMPALRRFDVDELLTRPGTYFNPETEIVLDRRRLGPRRPRADRGRRRGRRRRVDPARRRPRDRRAQARRAGRGLRDPPRPLHRARGPGRGRARRRGRARAGSRRVDVELAQTKKKTIAEDDVDREELHALEPGRLAVLRSRARRSAPRAGSPRSPAR